MSKLYAGRGGDYLDITLLENKGGTDQYGNDFMVVQDLPKADREAGQKGAILGNGKKWEKQSQPAAPRAARPARQPLPPESDEPPF